MGINLGAILGPFLAGALGENVHWGWGYFAAALGLLVSVVWLKGQEHTLQDKGLPPNTLEGKLVLDAKDWREIFVFSVALIISTLVIIFLWRLIPENLASILITVGFIGLLVGLATIIFKGTEGGEEWSRMVVIVVLAFFNIVFWLKAKFDPGTRYGVNPMW